MSAHKSKIEELAYRIWEEEGRPEGRDLEHWLQAESRVTAAPAKAKAPAKPKAQAKEKVAKDVKPKAAKDVKPKAAAKPKAPKAAAKAPAMAKV